MSVKRSVAVVAVALAATCYVNHAFTGDKPKTTLKKIFS